MKKKFLILSLLLSVVMAGCGNKENNNLPTEIVANFDNETVSGNDLKETNKSEKTEKIDNKTSKSNKTPIGTQEPKEVPNGGFEEQTRIITEEKNEALEEAITQKVEVAKENPLIKNTNLKYEFVDEIPDEYMNEVIGIIIDSIKNLDYKTLSRYMPDGISYEANFNTIKNDEKLHELWNNTIGSIIYLKDSRLILGKNVDYIYSSWYTDCYKNDIEISVANVSELNIDQAIGIYNTYYADAPYAASNDFLFNLGFTIVDGRLILDPSYIFSSISYPCFDLIFEPDGSVNSGILIFGNDYNFSLGYDYIRGSRDFYFIPNFESFLNKDMDGIIAATEELSEEEQNGPYWECYQNYFKNEENKAKLKDYLDNNAIFTRGTSSVYCFYRLDIKSKFPSITDSDLETINKFDIDFMSEKVIYTYPTNFSHNFIFYDMTREIFK